MSVSLAAGPRSVLRVVLAITVAAGSVGADAQDAARRAEAAGSALYETGVGPAGGTLSARAGSDASWVLRGQAVACANCHGLKAAGGGEGYQRAPSLLWPEWSSSDARVRAAARARLDRAVHDGHAQDGRSLSSAMPRFDIDAPSLDALALHLARLVSQAPTASPRTFAMLRLTDKGAPQIERDVHDQLQACLRRSLGDRVRVEVRDAAAEAETQSIWSEWSARTEIVAVLAPPWRQWPPGFVDNGASPAAGGGLPALFPLVADPDLSVQTASWLFGGVHARTVALVQAWVAHQPPREPLSVWAGQGRDADERWRSLVLVAEAVFRGTGRQPLWQRLQVPVGTAERPSLWLDTATKPGPGWWLAPLPLSSGPDPQVRLWTAQPYAGRAMRPLAQRWAEATCRTLAAALDKDPQLNRARWRAAIDSVGRLNDGNGWDWRPSTRDRDGYGSSDGWTIVELVGTGQVRLVEMRIDVPRPASE